MNDVSPATAKRTILFPVIVYGAICNASLLCAPALADQLIRQLHLDARQVGLFFSIEFMGYALSGIVGSFALPKFRWDLLARVSAALFLVGSLGTLAVFSSFPLLLVARAVTSLGSACLNVIIMASANDSARPTRTYGLYVTAQLITGVVGLSMLPVAFVRFGLGVYFVLVATAIVLAAGSLGAVVRSAPLKSLASTGREARPPSSTPLHSGRWLLARFPAIILFYIGVGGVWTFSGAILARLGLSPVAAGQLLSLATVGGIVGSGMAAALGGRRHGLRPLIGGMLLMILSTLMFIVVRSIPLVAFAAFAFKFAWTFALPFIFSTLGRIDRDGRIVAEMSIGIGIGLSGGPALAGLVLEYSTIDAVLGWGAIAAATSLFSLIRFESVTRVKA